MTQINDLNEAHTIVKYNNRKLYSISLSRYIKLTNPNNGELTIETLLRNNIPITVTDNKTGIDITDKIVSGVINGMLKDNPNLSNQVFNFIDNLTNGANHEVINV